MNTCPKLGNIICGAQTIGRKCNHKTAVLSRLFGGSGASQHLIGDKPTRRTTIFQITHDLTATDTWAEMKEPLAHALIPVAKKDCPADARISCP